MHFVTFESQSYVHMQRNGTRVISGIASVYFGRTTKHQTADNTPFDLRQMGLMKTPKFTEKNISFGDVSCAALPVSDYLFKQSQPAGYNGRQQTCLVFYNTTCKYVASTLEIRILQNKHYSLSTGHNTVNGAIY